MKGSITLFISTTISLFLLLILVLVEGARENALFLQSYVVTELASKSSLAEYQKPLWDDFGILAIDCGYDSRTTSYAKLVDRIYYYLERNVETKTWLALDPMHVYITEVELLSDNKGSNLLELIVRSKKSEWGIVTANELLALVADLEAVEEKSSMLEQDKLEIQSKQDNVDEKAVEIEAWTIKENSFLLEQILGLKKNQISNRAYNTDSFPSSRTLLKGGSMEPAKTIDPIDKGIVIAYAVDKFDSYLNQTTTGVMAYELEYLVAGKQSDMENLEYILHRILWIRNIDNYIWLQTQADKVQKAQMQAAVICILAPKLHATVTKGILAVWAQEESVKDIEKLLQGEKVPFRIHKAVTVDYHQYLSMFLMLESSENLGMRMLDLMEITIREKEAYHEFHIDQCVVSYKVHTSFEDVYNKTYDISQTVSY